MTRHRLAEAVPPDHYAAASETQRRLLPWVVLAIAVMLDARGPAAPVDPTIAAGDPA